MSGFFYKLGKLAGPKVRKAKWAWASMTASEAERIKAERAVGKDISRDVLNQYKIYTGIEKTARLQEVSKRLSRHVKNKQQTFHFSCIETVTPEAFCLPGGFIFVSQNMLDLCENDLNQLAFVLAHEMAHVLEGHAVERLAANSLIAVAARSKGGYAFSSGLQKMGIEFFEKAYSRDQELRADQRGLQLMKASGFESAGATRLLSKLESLEYIGLPGSYFSTHPNCRERIAQLLVQ